MLLPASKMAVPVLEVHNLSTRASPMRIFLSAVSKQFKACRDALASDLRAVGAEVVAQQDFTQAGGSLLEKLEAYIASV
jgi:hypothetical protein